MGNLLAVPSSIVPSSGTATFLYLVEPLIALASSALIIITITPYNGKPLVLGSLPVKTLLAIEESLGLVELLGKQMLNYEIGPAYQEQGQTWAKCSLLKC